MNDNKNKLISVASESLAGNLDLNNVTFHYANDLIEFLTAKNGFFAFEAALRVFPLTSSKESVGLVEWNKIDGWRKLYSGVEEHWVFFAEDIFGCQFCFIGNEIFSFDPETGETEFLARSLDEWCEIILDDYEVLTGAELAHQWQKENQQLLPSQRLLPKVPFVCGGAFETANLYAIDAAKGMEYRASIAKQIKDLPDGVSIKFKVIE